MIDNADPDTLAALVCAALREAGATPHVQLRIEQSLAQKFATAIEVRRSRALGSLVAVFPIRPVEITGDNNHILAGIIARLGAAHE